VAPLPAAVALRLRRALLALWPLRRVLPALRPLRRVLRARQVVAPLPAAAVDLEWP